MNPTDTHSQVPGATALRSTDALGTSTTEGSAAALGGNSEIRKRSRGYLPHWEREGGIYFVTFRLGDSHPARTRDQMVALREMFARARALGRPVPNAEARLERKLNQRQIEFYLDNGCGECLFNRPKLAEVVVDTLRFLQGKEYLFDAWCVMPNHAHAQFQPLPGYGLAKIVAAWKSVSSHRANELLGRKGSIWQRESYDHLIRNEDERRRGIEYIRDNPLKAGLTNWPWVYVRERK